MGGDSRGSDEEKEPALSKSKRRKLQRLRRRLAKENPRIEGQRVNLEIECNEAESEVGRKQISSNNVDIDPEPKENAGLGANETKQWIPEGERTKYIALVKEREKLKLKLPENKLCFTAEYGRAYTSSGDARLDLFYEGLRRLGWSPGKVVNSYIQNPQETVALLLHARDCRGGKGERDCVFDAFMWLRRNCPKTYMLNLRELVEVGCYRDLLKLASLVHVEGRPPEDKKFIKDLDYRYRFDKDAQVLEILVTKIHLAKLDLEYEIQNEEFELGLICEALKKDEATLDEWEAETDRSSTAAISLAAKWAPNENGQYDRDHKGRLARQLRHMLYDGPGASKRYRKLLVRLRKHLGIIEQLMTDNRWDEINFSHVPSKAHKNYRKAFENHQPDRYTKYLDDVKSGKEKINTTGLMPHELVAPYLNELGQVNASGLDETIEAQWRGLISKLKKEGRIHNAVAVVDTSKSMWGRMSIAIALGLVVCLLAKKPWHRQLISFSRYPYFHKIRGKSLFKMYKNVLKVPYGLGTDFNMIFDRILQRAEEEGAGPDVIPGTIFVFSDMHFESAGPQPNYESVKQRFEDLGYRCPQMVFWNLAGYWSGGVPVKAAMPGVSLISGFSSDLLTLFMNGGEISALGIMFDAIAPYLEKVQIDPSEEALYKDQPKHWWVNKLPRMAYKHEKRLARLKKKNRLRKSDEDDKPRTDITSVSPPL